MGCLHVDHDLHVLLLPVYGLEQTDAPTNGDARDGGRRLRLSQESDGLAPRLLSWKPGWHAYWRRGTAASLPATDSPTIKVERCSHGRTCIQPTTHDTPLSHRHLQTTSRSYPTYYKNPRHFAYGAIDRGGDEPHHDRVTASFFRHVGGADSVKLPTGKWVSTEAPLRP